jgi:hypothetical protein
MCVTDEHFKFLNMYTQQHVSAQACWNIRCLRDEAFTDLAKQMLMNLNFENASIVAGLRCGVRHVG